MFKTSAEDHETDFEYEGSDNEEDEVQEGEPRWVHGVMHNKEGKVQEGSPGEWMIWCKTRRVKCKKGSPGKSIM